MKYIFPILLLNFIILSCEKSQFSKQDLMGDWKLETYTDPNENEDYFDDMSPRVGISFGIDSIENFNGYFDYYPEDKKLKYIGNFSSYSIKNNKIILDRGLFRKEKMEWEILKITKDTIFLKDKEENFYLKRINFSPSNPEDFDQIIFSTSGCYGTCPIRDISIDKNGNMLFYGEGYISPTGIFKGKVSQKQTELVFTKFRNANPLKLEDRYVAQVTDNPSLTTTYVKDGRIVKTIYDYGYTETPDELIWAYLPLAKLQENVNLIKMKTNSLPPLPNLELISFRTTETKFFLKKSEGFFLWEELLKSDFTDKTFNPKFEVGFMDSHYYVGPDLDTKTKHNFKKVTSDGRYFKFEFEDNSSKTYDLGYNFIERNFSESDFHPIKKSDD